MAKNSMQETKTNNLENGKRTEYITTFGYFDENKEGEMNFPPQNAKEYKGLLENLEISEMVIEVKDHVSTIDKNGKVVARVDSKGKVLTGKAQKEKTSKKSDDQVK